MYAAILLPSFALQCAMRAEPELGSLPAALMGESDGKSGVPFIAQINDQAGDEGVREGMSVPQAQARCARLILRRKNSELEKIAANILLQSAERVSPYIEHTLPGCCTVDLRRNGEIEHAAWAKDLVAEFETLGLSAKIGIALTPEAALQAAHLAQPVLVTSDSSRTLAQLPVMVLQPTQQIMSVLFDWGIHRVGDLTALDRQQVAERLGVEGLALWDRAGGGKLRPLRLVRAKQDYLELVEFDGGVETLEPVLFRLQRCLEQLTNRLRADFLLVGAIELILQLDDKTTLARRIQIPAPTCDVAVLFRVISTYLDTVQTKSSVNGFRIEAFPSTPRDHQSHLWEGSLKNPNGFSETLARLNGVVGADHVGTPRRLARHKPDSFRLDEPNFDSPRSRKLTAVANPRIGFPALGLSLRRYRPPFRVDVQDEDGAPAHVHSRDVEGEVSATAGPWRVDGDWWELETAWRWEEWDIELASDGIYRIARHRENNWWALGMYD